MSITISLPLEQTQSLVLNFTAKAQGKLIDPVPIEPALNAFTNLQLFAPTQLVSPISNCVDSSQLVPMLAEIFQHFPSAPLLVSPSTCLDYSLPIGGELLWVVSKLPLADDPIPDCKQKLVNIVTGTNLYLASFFTPAALRSSCQIGNRPTAQQTTTLLSISTPPPPPPDGPLLAEILNQVPSVAARNLGRFYFVKDPDRPEFFSIYRCSNSTKRKLRRSYHLGEVLDEIANYQGASNPIVQVNTYSDMLNYTSTLARNTLIYVTNATGDATVEYGAAIYFYRHVTSFIYKVIEVDMNNGPTYSRVQLRPSASALDIDDLVNKNHSHPSIVELNKFNLDNGDVVYKTINLAKPNSWLAVQW